MKPVRDKSIKWLAVDTECTGIDLRHDDAPFALSTCDNKGNTTFYEWRVDPFTRDVLVPYSDARCIYRSIELAPKIIMHNALFDVRALALLGVPPDYWSRLEDTMLASHVLDNSESHALDDLGLQYCDMVTDSKQALREATISARAHGKKKQWKLGKSLQGRNEVARDYWMVKAIDSSSTLLETYTIDDAITTSMLWPVFKNALQSKEWWHLYIRRKKLLPIIYDMESRGVTLRKRILSSEMKRYASIVQFNEYDAKISLKRDLNFNGDINLNSSKQLIRILYGECEVEDGVLLNCNKRQSYGLPIIQTTNTSVSTSQSTLEQLYERTKKENFFLSKQFLSALLRSRKANTAFRYLRGYNQLCKGNILHPSINITGTQTTRFSSSHPNSQNIGKGEEYEEDGKKKTDFQLRSVFGPAPGRIWYPVDYSQLQLRIFAYASQEQSLLDAFSQGWDAHDFMACKIFDTDKPTKLQRRIAKNVNFGFIFGAQPAKIAATSGREDIWDIVTEMFPNAIKFLKTTSKQASRKGYVNTLSGYRLFIPKGAYNEAKGYTGVVYIVQGTEGEIVQEAMRRCWLYFQKHNDPEFNSFITSGPFITLQVHDELVFDFPRTGRNLLHVVQLAYHMEQSGKSFGIETPVEISRVRKSWNKPTELTFDELKKISPNRGSTTSKT